MSSKTSFWLTPKGLAALGLIGSASYFLLMEHRQHLFEFLPFLIILACPLMHLFMHGGHGSHGSHEGQADHGRHASHNSIDQDDYRRGYEDALKEAASKQKGKEDRHAR